MPGGAVRYHVPRDRSPVPAVLVGALVVVTLVSAQLSIAGETSRSAPASTAAASAAEVGSGTPTAPPTVPPTAPPTVPPTALPPEAAPSSQTGAGLPQPVEVTFAVGADVPSASTDALLGPVVTALLADPVVRVRVVGHAEASNDPVLEEQLSLRRAETVLALLSERGIPEGRADVFAAGASQAGQSVSGTDRRVVVEVVGP